MPAAKSIRVSAGERAVVQRRRFSSMPTDYEITVEPAVPGETLAGTLEVSASAWIFPEPVKIVPLQGRHRLSAGMFNTFYSIAVHPGVEVIVTRTNGRLSGDTPLFRIGYLIALLLLIGLAGAVAVYLHAG